MAILETTVDAIITTDDRGRMESLNRAAEHMFGYEADEMLGCNVAMLMPETHASSHDQYMRDHGRSGNRRVLGRTREIMAQRRDGSQFPIELALSSAEINGRRVFTGIIRDISRRRESERELWRYRAQLEEMVAKRTSALEAANDRLENTQSELRIANSRLEQMARVDELTSIGNRRAFDERLMLEWRRRQRDGGSLSVILCDVDHFKRYNDQYGHPAGDECLRRIAAAIKSCFQRATDFAARYGGEEFAVILAKVDAAMALERAEALRESIHALAIEHAGLGSGRQVSVSIGVASCEPGQASDPVKLVEAADAAMYRAKENGRDRVEVA